MEVDQNNLIEQIATYITDISGKIIMSPGFGLSETQQIPYINNGENIFNFPAFNVPGFSSAEFENATIWPIILVVNNDNGQPSNYIFAQKLRSHLPDAYFAINIISGEHAGKQHMLLKTLTEAAHVSEEKFQALIETIPDVIFVKDAKGRWLSINSAARKLFRVENLDWKGKTELELAELNPPLRDVHLHCSQSDQVAWATGALCRCEESLTDEKGNIIYFDTLKLPVYETDGSRKGLIVVGRDITDIKARHVEQLLQHQIQEHTNKILKASLENKPLEDCLKSILEIVTESPFINIQKQGGIFLTDDSGNNLKLTCEYNFPDALKIQCRNVPYGKCICGQAAQTCRTLYVNCVNHLHHINYDGMQDHGHYSVPIMYQGKALGVMMVYLDTGHTNSEIEIRFLDSVANILAGMIHRRKAEEQVIANFNFLEELEKYNVIFQNGLTHDDLDKLNYEVLQALLQTYGSDRAWLLYPCDPDAETWSVPMECTRKEYPGAYEMGRDFPMTDEYRMIYNTCLNSADAMVMSIQNDAEESPEDYEMAKTFGIKAGIAICLKPPKGKPWLLGMHQCSYYRIWTNEERRLLKQIAERYAYILNSIVLLNELKKSEKQFRSLAETANDLIITCDARGKFRYINSEGLAFAASTEAELKEKNIFDFVAPDDREKLITYFQELLSDQKANRMIELNLRSNTGESVPFEVNSSLERQENGWPIVTSVIRNITERKAAKQKLIQQNAELQHTNRELDQLVYSASHDLRAPLTSVMGLINLATDSIDDKQEVLVCLKMMETSVQRLDNVIKSIIGYSKNKRLDLTPEPINMKELFNSIMESISFIDELKQVLVYSDIDDSVAFISDKMRVETILSNLITNAIKYRREIPDSYVKVVFTINKGVGILSVEDNGEGVPEEKQKQIFEMFYRNSLAADGSGLGLYIVKQNIIKLNGTITLKSKYGKGSTFTVTLPNLFHQQLPPSA